MQKNPSKLPPTAVLQFWKAFCFLIENKVAVQICTPNSTGPLLKLPRALALLSRQPFRA